MGTAPQEQFHFSGFSQLRKSQGAEHGPLPPPGEGAADISGASKTKSPLAVADGGGAAPPGPSWGEGAPTCLASARMLIERRDRLLSAGSPRLDQRPVGAGLGHWWVMPYVCLPLRDVEPNAQALCPSPMPMCVSVGPMSCPTRESAESTRRGCYPGAPSHTPHTAVPWK